MSYLQTAMRAKPVGSYIDKEGFKIERVLASQKFQLCQEEILEAKRIQQSTGVSWTEALRQAKQLIENENMK